MKEFTTIQELASAKTREEIVTWAAEMQKCPYDYEGEAFGEDVCKEGEDGAQCNQCWLAALKSIVCKGEEVEEKPKKTIRKKKVENPDSSLAAKNSNEGVKALKALCKTMTKVEFEEGIKSNKICPSHYGFPDTMANCQKHVIGAQCAECWKTIVDTMEFKIQSNDTETIESGKIVHVSTLNGSEDDTQEKTNIDTTELVAPVKNNVKVLAHMDKLVEEIKNFKAQQTQWDALLKEKIAEATAKVEEEKAKLQRAIDYNMSQIVVEFPQVEAKETKTQKKVSVVSGDIILKKATEKIDYDKDKLLAYAKEKQLTDYIKIKEEFNWGDYKKTLNIVDGNIVDADGVVLKVDGLSVVTTEESLEVQ